MYLILYFDIVIFHNYHHSFHHSKISIILEIHVVLFLIELKIKLFACKWQHFKLYNSF